MTPLASSFCFYLWCRFGELIRYQQEHKIISKHTSEACLIRSAYILTLAIPSIFHPTGDAHHLCATEDETIGHLENGLPAGIKSASRLVGTVARPTNRNAMQPTQNTFATDRRSGSFYSCCSWFFFSLRPSGVYLQTSSQSVKRLLCSCLRAARMSQELQRRIRGMRRHT